MEDNKNLIRQEKNSENTLNDLDLLIAKAFSIGDR